MSYIRSKMIYGCGPYYYEVRSVREGKKVRQVFVRYVGKSPDGEKVEPEPKAEPKPKAYLEIEGADGRKKPKTWDKARYDRARAISRATGSSLLESDNLAKTAWRLDMDPEKVHWDELQGKDLEYEAKVEKLGEMAGVDVRTDKDIEAAYDYWLESEKERKAYREG